MESYSDDEDGATRELSPEAGGKDECKINAHTVIHMFASDLFSLGCAGLDRDDGVLIQAAPRFTQARGDLMDDHTWSVMVKAMHDNIVSAVLFTPPSSTYVDKPTACLPALRTCQDWFGVAGLPTDIRASLRDEDLAWLRTGEAVASLNKQGKPWTVAFEKHGDVSPLDLLTVKGSRAGGRCGIPHGGDQVYDDRCRGTGMELCA